MGVLFLLFGILFFRLFSLQILHGAHYIRLSEKNRVRIEPVEAPRGIIMDRNGTVLVDNRPSYTISIIPHQLEHGDRTIAMLGEIIGMDPKTIQKKIEAQKSWPYQPVKLKRDVGFSVLSKIEEHRYELPGVIYQIVGRRSYPFDDLAAHLLGYVGEPSRREFARLAPIGYLYGELIGKQGMERQYEAILHGRSGMRTLEVNAMGQEIGPLSGRTEKKAEPGADLHLTLDLGLQRAAEQAFPDSLAGSLVALDPRNGEVLAMVSRPSFDLNLFGGVLPLDQWKTLNHDPQHPLLDRAVQSAYPPASTLKMVTSLAGLATGKVRDERRFLPCTGAYRFGNRVFKCWKEEGHGALDLMGAITQSCDVYFYQLGEKVGLSTWGLWAEKFGFGRRTDIDVPGEVSGLVPSPSYYDQRYGKGKWSRGVMLNLAIGQGEMLMTPIQMACYTAALANGGSMVRPHILKEVVEGGRRLFHPTRQLQQIAGLSPGDMEIIRKSMFSVVNAPHGTGGRARVPGFGVAGKTGTAQNPHGEDHSWFIAFAPFDHPTIAVAAVVENAGHGSAVAAPLVQKVLKAHLGETAIKNAK
ncbi:MAG: penicillin-binding protein 2 [Candidatus Latescibacteria bacterium]|nr:penicillin-binding protein 2 [Candidatus Latescibacterota bacterium]